MEAPPTTLFESYEQDFRSIIQTVREKLDGDANQPAEQRKAALRGVEIELDEADDIVSQLEIEIQGIPQSIKPQYTTRLKQAKSDLAKYKKQAKGLHAQLSRADLLGRFTGGSKNNNNYSDDPYGEGSDRARLLTGTQTLEDGSRRLESSKRVALQSEAQGADILRSLREQREQIEHTRETLTTADTHIDRATGTIKGMMIQMYRQRIVLGAILSFFIVLVLVILYFKFFRR